MKRNDTTKYRPILEANAPKPAKKLKMNQGRILQDNEPQNQPQITSGKALK